CQQETEWSLTF
nr:immunoglobulin light chain junction region [Macaca mulatta]MOV61567.1 immunoglobulin light chain junction region [Macaca mulatta]MOV64103.1 immunoglobulin light chain junction region [Macaca mulatta]